MPRFEAQRITPKQAVDSSQSANVNLPVQANLASASGAGAAMFAMGKALNGISNAVGDIGMDEARRKNAKAAAKKEDDEKRSGEAKAAEHDVTGVDQTEWLSGASQLAKDSYMETDGINAVDKFQSHIQGDLAKMEPGSDIDGYIKTSSEQFIADNKLEGRARDSFLMGLAKTQDGIKQGYLKQSIKESMKREEEGASALLVNAITKGGPDVATNYSNWRTINAGKGMTDDEMDHIAVDSVKASIASGDMDIAKGMSILQTATGAGRPVLADIPEHKEELQLAAKRGETIQKDRAEKARYDQEVAETVQIDALADKGILGKSRALAWGKANDKSASEVAAKINSSREAGERLAKEANKAQEARNADRAWNNYDALAATAAGIKPAAVGEAGDRQFVAALQSGDDKQIQAVLNKSALSGAPIPALKGILSGSIDENDPKRATRYVQIFEQMQRISPEWASRQVDDKTLSRITAYQDAKKMGADDTQAWSKVKMVSTLDHETIATNVGAAMKLVAKEAPKDFTSEHFWQSNTPIANTTEMDTAYRIAVKDMVESGASPEVAAKAALTRVKSSFIRVGDRMVRNYGTGDGMDSHTSDAMTEASKMWKEKLVSSNVVGKDDPVWFTPIPGDENKWRLSYFAAGGVPLPVTHEVTRKGADGTERKSTEFVDVIPSAARANYSAWDKAEKDKKVRNEQMFKQLQRDPTDLTPENIKKLNDQYAPLLKGKLKLPAGTDPATAEFQQRQWDASLGTAKKVTDYANNPANQQQSFADFITSNH
jgi:hypothetical protein